MIGLDIAAPLVNPVVHGWVVHPPMMRTAMVDGDLTVQAAGVDFGSGRMGSDETLASNAVKHTRICDSILITGIGRAIPW